MKRILLSGLLVLGIYFISTGMAEPNEWQILIGMACCGGYTSLMIDFTVTQNKKEK
jgi:hypothetical protein